jgi:surface antigen
MGKCLKRKLKRVFQGSQRDPLFLLGIISVILFGLVSLSSGFLLNSLSNQGNFSLAAVSKIFEKPVKEEYFLDSTKQFWPESPEFLLVENSSLKSATPPSRITPRVLAALSGLPEPSNEITKHLVKSGESLWSIAKDYGLRIETIIWANNIKNSIIRPGQELTILPVDGLIHIVKAGETLESIAERYEVDPDKITYINDISAPDEIFENEALIIPGAELPSFVQSGNSTFINLSTNNFYGLSHAYPYGQCTWWVAQKRAIPSWGNAKDWLYNAAASGFPVCQGSFCRPKVGAVISLKGSWLGHVGYVERVQGNKVIFSEMNYIGWGTMNYRSLRIGDSRILGYIYKIY